LKRVAEFLQSRIQDFKTAGFNRSRRKSACVITS